MIVSHLYVGIDLNRNLLLMENPAVQKKINRYVCHTQPIQCLYGVQLVRRYVIFNRMK